MSATHHRMRRAQRVIPRQTRLVAGPVAVHQVTERHDEIERLLVQRINRLRQLVQRVAVIEVLRHVGIDVGVLRVGDQAKAQRGVQRRNRIQLRRAVERRDAAERLLLQRREWVRVGFK